MLNLHPNNYIHRMSGVNYIIQDSSRARYGCTI